MSYVRVIYRLLMYVCVCKVWGKIYMKPSTPVLICDQKRSNLAWGRTVDYTSLSLALSFPYHHPPSPTTGGADQPCRSRLFKTVREARRGSCSASGEALGRWESCKATNFQLVRKTGHETETVQLHSFQDYEGYICGGHAVTFMWTDSSGSLGFCFSLPFPRSFPSSIAAAPAGGSR